MISIKNENIINAIEPIIAHQVNCRGVMGSGVAKALRNKYPGIFFSYKKYCNSMGAELLGKIQMLTMSNGKKICNIFGQDGYGYDKQYTDTKALSECIYKLYKYAKDNNLDSVAMPYKIGCGRGGANWQEVYNILDIFFNEPNSKINLILYKYKE